MAETALQWEMTIRVSGETAGNVCEPVSGPQLLRCDVDAGVHPGGSYAYGITVTNAGPSSFLPNMTMTDALPADVVLDAVDAASPWTCATGTTVVCTYAAALAPGASAAVITAHVHIADSSVLNSVTNVWPALT